MRVTLEDRDLLRDVHLRAGETDADVLVHGLDHVVDETLSLGPRDLGARNGLRDPPEHRMTQPGHLQDRHVDLTRDAGRT
jgi:hypothetical protein